ncbi:hypothetical protein FB548_3328 [Pseudoxanthomonas sp. 3HH-4]|uniref:hypothetical protein n=1 Tax=Pseudoxanthomonas sp. 3HH-4 TaxID=1690214 RepID=UPI001152BD37|nr:hypothetical protein [Pseudoxanthomonas sp. 3HH-4]TQM06952.1 hypothetical protein FB548_3328 [Pseudoxanthomonas sp. 3HH-4]
MRFVATLLLCLLSPCAWAQDALCEPGDPARVDNRDGSTLSLRVECSTSATRRYVAELTCADGLVCDRLQVEQDVTETPMGHAGLMDLDGDGMHEVEVRGMCGAGPNCEGDVYRIDPATRSLRHYLSDFYYELQVIEGWLVASGRSSCCSWSYRLWKLDAPHALPLDGTRMDLRVQVDATGDEDGNVDGAQCTFLRESGDNRVVVAPPSPALEAICRHYGESYDLTSPDTTPGAP